VRQLLTESTLLALLGGATGLVFTRWARDILWSMRPPMFAYAGVHLDLDGRVLSYTLAISLLTGILFGLAPALRATSGDLASDLKERTGQAESSLKGRRMRSVLVMGQVALSVVALVGAGLFLRSLWNAGRIDPGFDAARLGVVAFNVGRPGVQRRARARIRAASAGTGLRRSRRGFGHPRQGHTIPRFAGANRSAGRPGGHRRREGPLHLDERGVPGYLRTVAISDFARPGLSVRSTRMARRAW